MISTDEIRVREGQIVKGGWWVLIRESEQNGLFAELDALTARVRELEEVLRTISKMAGPGAAGTGAAGWLLTLNAPEIARAALTPEEPRLTP